VSGQPHKHSSEGFFLYIKKHSSEVNLFVITQKKKTKRGEGERERERGGKGMTIPTNP